jgi:hypothetical protein
VQQQTRISSRAAAVVTCELSNAAITAYQQHNRRVSAIIGLWALQKQKNSAADIMVSGLCSSESFLSAVQQKI